MPSYHSSSSSSGSMSSTDDRSAPGTKLRLLCLHGYLQNAEIFKSRIGSLRKGLKSRAVFEFMDAPFMINSGDEGAKEAQGATSGGRSWWQWEDAGTVERPSLAAKYTGWESSLEAITEAVRIHRPDGILGFSQGATATALFLASLDAARESIGPDAKLPSFAILVSGFLPRDEHMAGMIQTQRPSTPSLFVIGEADKLIPPERTKLLMDAFHPSCFMEYVHPGAHMVPTCSGEFKASLASFLDEQKEKLEQNQGVDLPIV
eukprot:gene16257-22433_t